MKSKTICTLFILLGSLYNSPVLGAIPRSLADQITQGNITCSNALSLGQITQSDQEECESLIQKKSNKAAFITKPVSSLRQSRSTSKGISLDESVTVYAQAKKQLPKDLREVYRVTEKLIRANRLGEQSWRVIIHKDDDINASSSDQVLITIYTALYDNFHADPDALACVIGHEFGHLVKKTSLVKMLKRETFAEEFKEEIEIRRRYLAQELEQAKKNAEEKIDAYNHLAGVWALPGYSLAESLIKLAVVASSRNEFQQMQAAVSQYKMLLNQYPYRLTSIVEEEWNNKNAKIINANQESEYLSDRVGMKFAMRAGYDPKGCIRVMDVFAQSDEKSLLHPETSTHPLPSERSKAMKLLLEENEYNQANLKEEGEMALKTFAPLNFTELETEDHKDRLVLILPAKSQTR
jgi:beta-barrel assembly-enhancing protease